METQLRAALIDWLRADAILANLVNTIAEEAPLRTAPPWLGLVASASTDWSTKDRAGREVRVALELHCRGYYPGTAADDPPPGRGPHRSAAARPTPASNSPRPPFCPPAPSRSPPNTRRWSF